MHIEWHELASSEPDQERQEGDQSGDDETKRVGTDRGLFILCCEYALPCRLPYHVEGADREGIEQDLPVAFRACDAQVFRCARFKQCAESADVHYSHDGEDDDPDYDDDGLDRIRQDRRRQPADDGEYEDDHK